MQHPVLLPYDGQYPHIHPTAWIAPGAVVIGDTKIGAESSVWFGAVVRGDVNRIRVGQRVNLQDGVICHVNVGDAALVIEDDVTVGHAAVLHGCTLGKGCLVGIGARILDHVVVGSLRSGRRRVRGPRGHAHSLRGIVGGNSGRQEAGPVGGGKAGTAALGRALRRVPVALYGHAGSASGAPAAYVGTSIIYTVSFN